MPVALTKEARAAAGPKPDDVVVVLSQENVRNPSLVCICWQCPASLIGTIGHKPEDRTS
jgi:hypothetical protein